MRVRFARGIGVGVLIGVTALTGCKGVGQGAELQQQVEQLSAISAEKDSLLKEVVANTKLMSDINAELAKVKDAKSGVVPVMASESPIAGTLAYRDTMLARIRDIATRVNESEERVRASQRRVRNLTRGSDSLKSQLATFQATITEFEGVIENQKATIVVLTEQVEALRSENVRLTQEKAVLTDQTVAQADTIKQMADKDNTVYYVIGSKDELKRKGVVVEEGRKFLFFGSKSLQPARELRSGDFTAIDKRVVSEILFPQADREYRIISRQNLASQEDADGKVTGRLQIAAPEEFWAPSKYLILVEQ